MCPGAGTAANTGGTAAAAGLQHAGYPSVGRSTRGGTTAGSGGSAAHAVLGVSLLGLAWGEVF